MKLAFCLFNYFPYGGLQRDFLRIAQACLERGHEIHVYTLKWEGEIPEGFQVTLVSVHGVRNHVRCWNFSQVLPRYFQQLKPDLVIGFNKIPGLNIYYAADPCYVAKSQSRSVWYRLSSRYKTFAKLERAVFERASQTQIFLLAAREQVQFIRYYETPTERFHLLPPGISRDRCLPKDASHIRARLRKEWQVDQNDYLILFIGSGFKTKGLDRAFDALAALPTTEKRRSRLLIIGQDNPAPFLRLVRKLKIGDYVRFLGGRSDVAKFLWSADLLLHPAYAENTGTVLLEALVAGLPVLTTDVCGYADHILKAKAGVVLSSPFDQKKLNQQLAFMFTAKEKSIWRENALAYAARADLYSLVEEVIVLLENSAEEAN